MLISKISYDSNITNNEYSHCYDVSRGVFFFFIYVRYFLYLFYARLVCDTLPIYIRSIQFQELITS